MKKQFCDRCYSKPTCNRLCAIVEAELTGKGIYRYKKDHETRKYTLELEPKQNEVEIIFMHEIDMELEWIKAEITNGD